MRSVAREHGGGGGSGGDDGSSDGTMCSQAMGAQRAIVRKWHSARPGRSGLAVAAAMVATAAAAAAVATVPAATTAAAVAVKP